MNLTIGLAVFMFIPLAIILGMILYRAINSNQNHTNENGSKPFQSFNFIVILFLLVITTFSVVTLVKFNDENENLSIRLNQLNNSLESRYYSLNAQISSLQHELSRIQAGTGNGSGNDGTVEELGWIITKNYKFKGLTTDNKMTVEIMLSLREIENDSKLFLSIMNLDDVEDIQKIELTDLGTLTYKADVDLYLNQNYDVELISENEGTTKKEPLMELLFKDKFKSKVMFNAKYAETNQIVYNLGLDNYYYDSDYYKISKVLIRVYRGSSLKEEIDVTSHLNTGYEMQSLNYNGSYMYSVVGDYYFEVCIEDGSGLRVIERYEVYQY